MIKKNKTLLVVGDNKDFDTFKRFIRQKRFFSNSKIIVKSINYDSLLNKGLPTMNTEKLIIFLCFPFSYWDKHIEPKNYKGVYGNKTFYSKFVKFWKKVEKIIRKKYSGKKIFYINKPQYLATDRDKELTKKIVSKANVPVPKTFSKRTVKYIMSILDKGIELYIKVKFGSMGKGITFLRKDKWLTNFRYKSNKIVSKKSDYGWNFVDVTNNLEFLKKLLKEDIIIEEAISPLLIKDRKFDLRLYVYRKKILYIYVRSNDKDSATTNISQGAKGESAGFVDKLPKNQIERSKKIAVKAMKALGLDFGGVDIMLCDDKQNIVLIEVNSFPGFPKVRRFNLSRYLIKEMINHYD